jgi:translation initiation factor IF-1
MVKNFKGGNKSKGFARKSLLTTHSSSIRLPSSPLEHFAIVTHFFGNMFQVITLDQRSFKCHIRGKFKGRNKRSSLISVGSIVMIGERDFLSHSLHNDHTDLLEIYDSSSYPSLFNTPGYDFSPFLSILNQHSSSSSSSSIDPLIDNLFLSTSTTNTSTTPIIDSSYSSFHITLSLSLDPHDSIDFDNI